MGMFDRPEYDRFGEKFKAGDRFVLCGAEYKGRISTKYGQAELSILGVVSREHPTERREYQALGVGISDQAKRSTSNDFPVVVELVSVPTGNNGNEVKKLLPVPDTSPDKFIREGVDGGKVSLDQAINADSAPGKGSSDLGF